MLTIKTIPAGVPIGGGILIWELYSPISTLRRIQDHPESYSSYLKELVKPYQQLIEKKGGYEYGNLKYNAVGKMRGIYGYQVDSKKQSIPLNTKTATKTITETFTQTATPTNQANYLAVNKYSSAGLALLTGLFLV